MDVLPVENMGARAIMVELRVTPSKLFPLSEAVANITFSLLSRVCASCESTAIETLLEHEQRVCSLRLTVFLLHTEPEQRTPDYCTCEKKLAGKKSKVVASNVDRLSKRLC